MGDPELVEGISPPLLNRTMLIARVTGHIVATAKTPYYKDYKILRLVPESWDGSPMLNVAPIIALDLVDSGTGDRVLVCQEGRWARETLGDMNAPVRSMIVAIIDQISIKPELPSAPKS